MNRTSPPRSAQRARSSEEIPDPVADELRRYDDHLRDVRGLAAGTRHNRCRIVEQLLRKKFAAGVVNMATLRPVDIRRFIARQLGGQPLRQISPHMIRHTTAMHLLQSGVDITCVIALWLGHESPATTHQYVEADLAMKERALARLQEPEAKLRRYRAPDSLIDFLRTL